MTQKLNFLKKEINNNQTRKAGKIPVVLYGKKDQKDLNEQGAIDSKHFHDFLHAMKYKVLSTIFEINKELFIIKEIQIHPIHEHVVHIDFFRVEKDQEFEIKARVVLKNYEKAPFTKENGFVHIPSKNIKVLCTIDSIVGEIVCDLENSHKGDVISTEDPSFNNIKFINRGPIITIVDKS